MEADHECLDCFKINAQTPRLMHWQVIEIYLSEVCLAVHIEPAEPNQSVEDGWDSSGAKEELRTFLRQLRHLALSCDIICPVVAVIPRQCSGYTPVGWNDGNPVNEWIADQQWHRGTFVLYLEEDGGTLRKRLQAMLRSPHIDPLMGEFAKCRSLDEMTGSIRKRFMKSPVAALGRQYVLRLLDRFEALCNGADSEPLDVVFRQIMLALKKDVLETSNLGSDIEEETGESTT